MSAMSAMSAILALFVVSVSTLVSATSDGNAFVRSCVSANEGGYNFPEAADPCDMGPPYWCFPGSNNINQCNLQWVKNVTVCGYSSKECPVVPDVQSFCESSNGASGYLGGLVNLPPGYFGWLLLAMFWPPTNCNSATAQTSGFCTNYTAPGQVGSRTLQLHGMWPDFGSFYGVGGTPPNAGAPSFSTAYEGWPQYCSSNLVAPGLPDYSKCHVGGGLCPTSTTTQTDYDNCMAANNIAPCVISTEVVAALGEEFKTIGAGYLGNNGTLLNHEFTKHGSCLGGYVTSNPVEYFSVAVSKGIQASQTAAARFVNKFRGKAVPYVALQKAMAGIAVAECEQNCQLSELWFCYGKQGSGYPTDNFIQCGPGQLASDTCNPVVAYSNNCSSVIIPDFVVGPNKVAGPIPTMPLPVV